MPIKRAAVLGAGVMGAQLAGHLAGCGVRVLLMDIINPPQPPFAKGGDGTIPPLKKGGEGGFEIRNKFALDGIERLKKSKPAAMFDIDDLKHITPGNFEDDLPKIVGCDLIIEAVIEKIEIKEKLYTEIEKYLKPKTIVSSNTSGIRLKSLIEGRSPQFKKNFVITHFFNPVRYMKLVELIVSPETDPKIVAEIADFLENGLGKGVVRAKDTPNFIANRIGVHAVVMAFHAVEKNGWPIEVVDQIMGVPTCRPKSAIFRTADIVGLDTLALVAMNSGLEVPNFVQEMIKKGMIGDKGGGGFYKKAQKNDSPPNPPLEKGGKSQVPPFAKGGKGGFEILVIDPKTLEYRPQQKIKTPSLGKARDISDPAERLRTVVLADDEAGKIAKYLVDASIDYAASVADEIAHDTGEIDKAMRWGFNWELGPFEQMSALKIPPVPPFSKGGVREFPPFVKGGEGGFKKKILSSNPGADITDMGDGVFACEFHTKMNAIDGDVIAQLNQALDMTECDGKGLVLCNDGQNFSAGANLMMIFLAAQSQAWGQIADMVKGFQGATQRIRFCKRPVVAAPFGLTLGGGCEISIAAAHINAAAETYMGLVELGVGLIPAGGGCKNMLLRMEERHRKEFDPANKIWMAPTDGGPFPKVRDVFQTIAFAKVSMSAKEARKIGYMSAQDRITLDREKLFGDAKKAVLELAKNYQPPKYRDDITLPGEGGKMALVNGIKQSHLKGDVTEFETVLGEKLAHVLTGGDMPSLHKTDEQHILDLEREAFLSLCGMPKTIERIQHMLSTGKPLRN